jgi:hypothetical protein
MAQTQKAPIKAEDLRLRVRATTPKNLLGIRDLALLLVGFTGAFRRSELVALDVANLSFSKERVLINLRHSKTDQEGKPHSFCPSGGGVLQRSPSNSTWRNHWDVEVNRFLMTQAAKALLATNSGRIIRNHNQSKAPAHRDVAGEATSDMSVIYKWMADDALTGLSFFIESPAVLVIDVEHKNKKPGIAGPDGLAAWDAICAQFGIQESRYGLTGTPNGGKHVYMRLPPGRATCFERLLLARY